MFLTAAQTTTFFEDASQMGFSNRTWVHSLQMEGIITISDLSDYEDDNWNQWCSNLQEAW